MFDYAQKIWASPDAPRQIEALYEKLQDEKQRRNDFREWITPNIKAIFDEQTNIETLQNLISPS